MHNLALIKIEEREATPIPDEMKEHYRIGLTSNKVLHVTVSAILNVEKCSPYVVRAMIDEADAVLEFKSNAPPECTKNKLDLIVDVGILMKTYQLFMDRTQRLRA